MTQYKATITEIRDLSPSEKLYEIDLGRQRFDYQPGQWVDLSLSPENAEQNASFSITSTPNGRNTIEIAVKRTEHFPISMRIHEQLHVGDGVSVSEAQGNVTLQEPIAEPVFFIAGGSGITPFISMLRQLYSKNPNARATLLYSVTDADECLFYDELYALRQEYKNFRFYLTTTREAMHHADFFGRIGSEMLRRTGIDYQAHYYLCGPPQMVDDINELLLELSVAPNHIHFDKWW
jgi:ferredoxin-NADP reductase